MPVTNIRGFKPVIWIPPIYTARFKFEVIRSDGTVDDLTNLLSSLKITDGVTNTIGGFEFSIWNPKGTYTDVWTHNETVKYYCNYSSTATTKRFQGKIEKVSYIGNKVNVTGRSDSVYYMDITVTKTYSDMFTHEILKDLITSYSTGFTTNNVEVSNTKMTVGWFQKPFIEAVKELANISGFDFYVDNDKDWHFFLIGSKKNNTDAIVHNYNMLEIQDFMYDSTLVKNRVIVYGAKQDGIQNIYTSEDTVSQGLYGIKEMIYNNENILSYDQAKYIGDSLLAINKDPPLTGTMKGLLLATLQPGEQLHLSSPYDKIQPGYYNIQEYTHSLEVESGILSTTVKINKEPRQISHIFRNLYSLEEQKQDTSSNPYEMRYSYNFLFNSDSGSHNDTETTNGVLKLKSGKSSGTWISDSRTELQDVTQCYLIIVGETLTGVTIYVSGDNGTTYQEINKEEILTMTTAKGKVLRIKVTINNADTQIDSLSLQYTFKPVPEVEQPRKFAFGPFK